jgi:hypothetical protein
MQGFRRAAVMLALVAMAFRALVPAGWMPNPHGFAETAFIICDMGEMSPIDMAKMDMSGMGAAHMDMSGMDMSMDMPGMSKTSGDPSKDQAPAKTNDDGRQHEACPFAAAPHFATPSILAMLLPPSLADGISHRLKDESLSVHAAPYAPQSPRAPPALA